VTGWINRSRARRKAENRRRRHQTLIDNAAAPTERLQAACGWLVSEAREAHRLDDAFDAVMNAINTIREEETNDHHDYAA
jgi:hypothetical protein